MSFQSRMLSVFGAFAIAVTPAFAQLSAYYVTDGTAAVGNTHIWQGGGQSGTYAWGGAGEMPIVVGNFGSGVRVRQAVGEPNGNTLPQPGDEYLLNGTPTGFHNLWNPGDANVSGYDAAFDGSSIFMVDWNGTTTGNVYRYDNNYNGRTFMFAAHPGDIGITYDSRDNTIWTSSFGTGLVQEWSMTGTPLTSFFDASGSAAALAYDSADGTLWMSDGSSATAILNYDTSGNLIKRVVTNEYLLGGEMAAAPEPATMALLGLSAVALIRRRRSAK